MEVHRRRRKTQALAGATFPERLKPLFLYNFHRCVGKKSYNCPGRGGCCGRGSCGVGIGSDGWGRQEDATTDEGMGWYNKGKKVETKNIFLPTY